MKIRLTTLALAALIALPLAANAQNIAVVNGKAVPKARVDALLKQVNAQAAAQGQQLPPDLDQRARDKVVLDEIFQQEAERRGLAATPEYKQQMEQARTGLLIQALFADYQKKNPVTDADLKAEYDKFAAANGGKEYRARHILVEKEDEAKAIIAAIKGGAKFEDQAKAKSKDPGSGANGGDLDWANAASYVTEFSEAMIKLDKGQMTQEPVKSQFGYHIIRVDDVRQAKLPTFEELKPQIAQQMQQQKLGDFQRTLREKAKIQ